MSTHLANARLVRANLTGAYLRGKAFRTDTSDFPDGLGRGLDRLHPACYASIDRDQTISPTNIREQQGRCLAQNQLI